MFETEREQNLWVATWIDCEGNISIHKRPNAKFSNGCFWLPEIAITNTDEKAVRLLQEITGATARREINREQHWKIKWKLYLSPNKCRIWLPKIRSFLVIKQRQADLVIEALDLLQLNQRWAGPGKAQGKAEMAFRFERLDEIYQEVKRLNSRGIPVEKL